MSTGSRELGQDPDYEAFERNADQGQRQLEEDTHRNESVQRITGILKNQFSSEIQFKEREILVIDQRISQTRGMLDRLRAYVLANYYGSGGKLIPVTASRTQALTATGTKGPASVRTQSTTSNRTQVSDTSTLHNSKDVNSFRRPTTNTADGEPKQSLDSTVTSTLSSEDRTCTNEESFTKKQESPKHLDHSYTIPEVNRPSKPFNHTRDNPIPKSFTETLKLHRVNSTTISEQKKTTQTNKSTSKTSVVNRFYVKKRIIVGNVSKYLPLDTREKNDQSTHKWMVYVRGPKEQADVSSFVKKVWFFLHPSYMPNDIVEIKECPFQLTRRGWGEFPVRVQLHFCDSRNKKVDIIHHLKLDKTYTGLQTLGAETVVDLELHRHTVSDKEHDGVFERPSAPEVSVYEGKNVRSTSILSTSMESKMRMKSSYSSKDNELREYCKQIVENNTSFATPSNTDRGESPRLSSDSRGDAITTLSRQSSEIPSEDTSFVCSEPGSRITSRAASPIVSQSAIANTKLEKDAEKLLLKNLKNFPLIKENRDISKLHFCAKSVDQLKKWSFSKRRACEWQRAFELKKVVNKALDRSKQLSTKEVMCWCRRNGYTPTEMKMNLVELASVDFCPRCGKCFPMTQDALLMLRGTLWCASCVAKRKLSSQKTLTSFESCLTDLEQEARSLETIADSQADKDSEESELLIDVCLVDNSVNKATQTKSKKPPIVAEISTSLEMDWIYNIASQLEVHLSAVNMSGVRTPLLQAMLLSAMRQFVGSILRTSYCLARGQSDTLEPCIVTPVHVQEALLTIPECDFLTDASLGLPEDVSRKSTQ